MGGGGPLLAVLCEDKHMSRKKGINLHEHGEKEKQHMKIFN